jgi:hypothetical protein
MKRLVVLSVASMVAAGCTTHDTCDARTVSIGWPQFLLADGSQPTSCSGAGIGDVDVFMDDQPVATIPCTDGGVNVTGVLNDKDHLFTVEGIDSSTGAIALRAEVNVAPSNCSSPLVNTQPSEGIVELDYSFTPNSCISDVNSYIWFSIKDNISGDVITVDGTHSPQQYHCGSGRVGEFTPLPIQFALASGIYSFQRMEEVLYPGPVPTAGNCNSADFTITGATNQPVAVALANGVACF